MFDKIDQLGVNTLRTLSIDAIEKANSGHPGLPMGAAPMAYVLWTKHLNINPKNSKWFNRDRFILSAGHGSALLYSLLHLSGYQVSIDDLKDFRQYGSRTPGHPEVHYTDGVEATTGPLGQGFANGVGMAMAEAHLAETYNEESFNIIDHYTYVLCSDGDLQEGISHEAASLAGHLKLNKLIVLYDSNDIQLDGPLDKAFSEDIKKRFESYGWDYTLVEDGKNLDSIDKAIENAKNNSSKPSLIEIKTLIGEGSSKAGTADVHGAPLGEEEVKTSKLAYQWEFEDFHVPAEVYERFNHEITQPGAELNQQWDQLVSRYQKQYSSKAQALQNAIDNVLPKDWDQSLPSYDIGDESATRATSGEVINAIAKRLDNFWGGSADLSGSNKTMIKDAEDFSADNYSGRNIWYGVREHAMASALNGILLHGGTVSYASTFFVFSDYLRPAVRLAALSKLPSIYVFTHDSIAVGEDGPTHEPIEQLASYRAMHNLTVLRPADGNEVAASWRIAIESKDRPTMLVLTRQSLPTLANSKALANDYVKRGGYVISSQKGNKPDGILIATGSEVSLAIEAQKELDQDGLDVSVVSMPSIDLFEKQTSAYKETVLPTEVKKRLVIEMGASYGWDKYAGDHGKVLGIDQFGASGEGGRITEEYGFTVEHLVSLFKTL